MRGRNSILSLIEAQNSENKHFSGERISKMTQSSRKALKIDHEKQFCGKGSRGFLLPPPGLLVKTNQLAITKLEFNYVKPTQKQILCIAVMNKLKIYRRFHHNYIEITTELPRNYHDFTTKFNFLP